MPFKEEEQNRTSSGNWKELSISFPSHSSAYDFFPYKQTLAVKKFQAQCTKTFSGKETVDKLDWEKWDYYNYRVALDIYLEI